MTASSNGTPCLSALAFAFRGSHSNTCLVYTELCATHAAVNAAGRARAGEVRALVKLLDEVRSEHAEYLGEMYSTMNEGAPGHYNEQLKELRGLS